ncbi:DUF2971 domain-containing protein [Mucilaginibacter lappiensis]|uniref:DUF2971 domain-containing protein n=1 Tax=Mucilaginibacter lappiensis TaxID=354630 RepID=UPI003D24C5FB
MRFTALDKVDDLNEGLVDDVDNYQQFTFVSCWTNVEQESIPIWNMYAKDMSGVRIALPKYPFNHYSFNALPNEIISDTPFDGSTIVNKIHYDEGYIFQRGEHYLVEVEYTNDINLLKPKLVELRDEKHQTIWSAKVGRYKHKAWEFQSEQRYVIVIHPRGGFKQIDGGKFKTDSVISSKYIDIPIRVNAFEQMVILLGPKQLDSHRLIVEALIKKYNPKATVERSNLQIRH